MTRCRVHIQTACCDCGKPLSVRKEHYKDNNNRCRSCGALNKWANKAYREMQSDSHKGKALSQDHKDKISNALKGKIPPSLPALILSRPKMFGEAAMNSYFKAYQKSARDRKKAFTLTRDEFKQLVTSDCYYCGAPPSVVKKPHPTINGHVVVNGIDRMDNKVGYVAGNCAPACKDCNYAKQQMSVEGFISWVRKVADHLRTYEIDSVGSREILTK